MTVGEGHVLSMFEYHMFDFISLCDLFADSPSYIISCAANTSYFNSSLVGIMSGVGESGVW
jgi:hypothetical protein